MILFGVDPGSRVAGFGVIECTPKGMRHLSHGVIILNEKEALPLRLKTLTQELGSLYQKYEPDAIIVEKIFLGKNADSAFKLGHARGVAIAQAALSGAQVFEYATRQIKQGVAGKGSASKEEVQFMVEKYLKLKNIEHLDASDALALALYHGFTMQNRARISAGVLI